MKRSDQMRRAQSSMESDRREMARKLAAKQELLNAANNRLQELLSYREEYQRGYRERVGVGLGALRMRDYQAFLARLDQAICQQQDILVHTRAEMEFERDRVHAMSAQIAALASVAQRWRNEERHRTDRWDQKQQDELSQQKLARRTKGQAT
jgi:flagellar FliJ protein